MTAPRIYVEDLPSGRVRAGFRLSGRKIQRTHDYRYEAEQWATEARTRALAALALGLDPYAAAMGDDTDAPPAAPARAPRFRPYAERWLEARRGSVGESTWDGYDTHLRMILTDAELAALPLDAITKTDVEAWRTRSRAAGAQPPTLNARLKVIRMILRRAVDEKILDRDPSASVPLLKYNPTAKGSISLADEDRLLAECDDDERLLVLLGLDAGLRYSEAAAITAADVYLDDGDAYVHVGHTIARKTGRRVPETKSHRNRDVPVTPRLLAELRRAEIAAKPGAVLVTRDDGETPWTYDHHRHEHWRGLAYRAGLNTRGGKRRTFHELRHTYATRLHRAGVPLVDLRDLLGHADVETTEKYIHGDSNPSRHKLVTAALSRAV